MQINPLTTMKQVWIVLLTLLLSDSVLAQTSNGSNTVSGHEYDRSIGLKIFPGAVSYKWKWDQASKAEALLYMSSEGFRLTGLYEKYFPLTPEVPGLNWFIGGGAHWGIWSDNWKNKYPTRESGIAIGIDGVIGLDYKLKTAPLNISIDWQPSFNIIGYQYFEGGWGGIGIRYVLR
jgi:hypothetical protein